MNVSSFLWTSAGQRADGITPTHTHTHTWRTSTMSSRPLSSVSVGTRGVPGNYTTGWITCRSIDCRSIDCRSIDCRSNDSRSIDCRINGTTPTNQYGSWNVPFIYWINSILISYIMLIPSFLISCLTELWQESGNFCLHASWEGLVTIKIFVELRIWRHHHKHRPLQNVLSPIGFKCHHRDKWWHVPLGIWKDDFVD